MKIIKFRAYVPKEKKMYYDVIVTPDGWVYYEEGKKEIGLGDNGVDCFVSMFTGLHDNRKKEVWEDDLLVHQGKNHGIVYLVVEWKNYKWRFKKIDSNTGHPFMQLFNHPENFKVLSHIYRYNDSKIV